MLIPRDRRVNTLAAVAVPHVAAQQSRPAEPG